MFSLLISRFERVFPYLQAHDLFLLYEENLALFLIARDPREHSIRGPFPLHCNRTPDTRLSSTFSSSYISPQSYYVTFSLDQAGLAHRYRRKNEMLECTNYHM